VELAGRVAIGGVDVSDHGPEQISVKRDDGAIVAAIDRMADAIGFMMVEENDVVRIGAELAPADVLEKRASANERDIVLVRVLFSAATMITRTTAIIADPNEPAAE
jgi:hypothetical protein